MSYNQELLNLAMQNGQDYRLDDDQISGLSRSRSEERRLSEERRFGSYGPPESTFLTLIFSRLNSYVLSKTSQNCTRKQPLKQQCPIETYFPYGSISTKR